MSKQKRRMLTMVTAVALAALTSAACTSTDARAALRPHPFTCDGSTVTHIKMQPAWLPTDTHFPSQSVPPGTQYSVSHTKIKVTTRSIALALTGGGTIADIIEASATLTGTLTWSFTGEATVTKTYTAPQHPGGSSEYIQVFRQGRKVTATYVVTSDRSTGDKCSSVSYKESWYSPLKAKSAAYCEAWTDLVSAKAEVVAAANDECKAEY